MVVTGNQTLRGAIRSAAVPSVQIVGAAELARRLEMSASRVRQLLSQGYLETKIIGGAHAVTWPLVWLKDKPRGYVHYGEKAKRVGNAEQGTSGESEAK